MPTILVADDNSNIQKMVGIALKEHGIEVVAVGNGEAAVRKLAESLPDLILADIFMPVRNGYEVCEYVKRDDRFAHIPVVLLVGAFDPLDEHEVERVHADGVLKKPFVPPDPLIELVKSLLAKIAGAAAAAAPAPTDTQELEHEDVEQTQDLVPGLAPRSPTGTQLLTPEPSGRGGSGTVEIPRPEIPAPEKTQRLTPEGTLVSAENFRLDLAEPAPPPQMEKTQQLSATDISNILKRESSPTTPGSPPAEEAEQFTVPPAVVDFHGGRSPVAFEDLLESAQQTEEEPAEEPESPKSHLGLAAFEAAQEHAEEEEEHGEAEVHFGGIREEAKSPDPEMPPIPVEFGQSEPVEIITDEHVEHSGMQVGPAEDLVSSSSGWAASTGTPGAHAGSAGEPGLVSEGSEGFMTPPAPRRGIGHEETAPATEFSFPPGPSAAPLPVEEFEETTELPKHILEEEVNRAQDIAARVAAQNREFIAHEELAGPLAGAPLAGPAIDQAINAVDTILARHRAQAAAEPPVAPPPGAAAAPPSAPALTVEEVSPTSRAPRAVTPEMIEAVSERVLAQLDPYIIEKISKEIVRPILEAMIRRELEKLE